MKERANIRIGFKEKDGVVFGNIKKENGKWVGASAYDKGTIVVLGNFYTSPKTMYNCEVEIDGDNATLLFAQRFNHDYKIEIVIKKNIKTLKITIGDKKLYYDPVYGRSKNSTTLNGLIRAIKILPNNFNKRKLIDDINSLFTK